MLQQVIDVLIAFVVAFLFLIFMASLAGCADVMRRADGDDCKPADQKQAYNAQHTLMLPPQRIIKLP